MKKKRRAGRPTHNRTPGAEPGILSRSREGFFLVSALVVVLVGSFLVMTLYTLSTSFHDTAFFQRQAYRDYLDAMGFVEKAKGFILARNKERASEDLPVLHGRGSLAAPSSRDYFPINSLADLQVNALSNVGDALSRDVALAAQANVPRRLTLKVYDANYKVTSVNFVPDSDMPASLYPSLSGEVGNGSGMEEEGSVNDPTKGKAVSEDLRPNYFNAFGAYLIRVELFRGNAPRPLRRVEVLFSQLAVPPSVVSAEP